MDILKDYLQQVQSASFQSPKEQPQGLLNLLRLHPSLNPWIVKIYNIGVLSDNQVREEIRRRNLFNDEWMAFQELVESFVKLSNQMNPYSMLESFDLYANYLNALSVAFTNKSYGFTLTPLIQDTIDIIKPMATQLDLQLLYVEKYRRPRLVFLASLLLKIFNNIRSQLGANDHIETAKKSIMLFIGVRLCQTYFQLLNPLLCRNVFSNMNNANLKMIDFPKSQQVQYRYYLGKFYMAKYHFVDAYQHFHWCLLNTPSNYMVDNSNVTQILRHLIPLGIIIGKKPNMNNIRTTFYSSRARCPKFLDILEGICAAVQLGDFNRFTRVINKADHYQVLKKYQLLLLFAEKAPILILRNLVRRVWNIQGCSAKLDYDSIRLALTVSLAGRPLSAINCFGECQESQREDIDDFAVENCLVTLIDQNLLKGKLFPRLRVVSLSKTGVFPPIATILFLKFGNGPEGKLNYADKWMEQGR